MKIARLMRERELEPPVVTVREGAVVVTLRLPAPVKTPVNATGKGQTPEKTPEKRLEKTPEAILGLFREAPNLSAAEVASRLGRSESAVHRAIRKLRKSGRLRRIGPDKGGHWQVIG